MDRIVRRKVNCSHYKIRFQNSNFYWDRMFPKKVIRSLFVSLILQENVLTETNHIRFSLGNRFRK
ncbi:hypothetical protein DLM78_13925 [Leptospira stimsonii]|uniref:Uncharacterized protein n=1 Tax=Leptospira stimsonii TaxID=2202203 RepID=A0A8B3CR14_9LEPT|nr:hypothetical protein DLM78_13925 [Leptospira stimsonii]